MPFYHTMQDFLYKKSGFMTFSADRRPSSARLFPCSGVFLLAAAGVAFSFFAPFIEIFGQNNGWFFASWFYAGQSSGVFLVMAVRYPQVYRREWLADAWQKQANRQAPRFWERNLLFWTFLGRIGIPLVGVATMFTETAVVNTIFSTHTIWLMLFLSFASVGGSRQGRQFGLGRKGWLAVFGGTAGVILVSSAQDGVIGFALGIGGALALAGAMLDAFNVERSIRIAEMWEDEHDGIAASIAAVAVCQMLIAVLCLPLWAGSLSAGSFWVFAGGFAVTFATQPIPMLCVRLGNLRATRSEANLIVLISAPLGLLWLWLLSLTSLTEMGVARLDWIWVGTLLVVASAALGQTLTKNETGRTHKL